MADITAGINMASPSNYGLDQILQATKPPSTGGGFRSILGGLVSSVGNMFAPGMGGMIGGLISGGMGGGGTGGLLNDSMQYLQLQKQMNAQADDVVDVSRRARQTGSSSREDEDADRCHLPDRRVPANHAHDEGYGRGGNPSPSRIRLDFFGIARLAAVHADIHIELAFGRSILGLGRRGREAEFESRVPHVHLGCTYADLPNASPAGGLGNERTGGYRRIRNFVL